MCVCFETYEIIIILDFFYNIALTFLPVLDTLAHMILRIMKIDKVKARSLLLYL